MLRTSRVEPPTPFNRGGYLPQDTKNPFDDIDNINNFALFLTTFAQAFNELKYEVQLLKEEQEQLKDRLIETP